MRTRLPINATRAAPNLSWLEERLAGSTSMVDVRLHNEAPLIILEMSVIIASRNNATMLKLKRSSFIKYASKAPDNIVVINAKKNAEVACNCASSVPWNGGVAPYKDRTVLNAARTNT